MANSLLITRPEHDLTTRYLSKWSEEIIRKAHEKGLNVIDLIHNKAERGRVVGILEKRNPRFVVLNGHGNDHSVSGHDNRVILETGDQKAVQSKIIFARSCRSAKTLGQAVVEQGATAYLGYKEDFWFMLNEKNVSRPTEDKTAALFLEPSNHVAISLLKGHTTGDSNAESRALFRKNIERLLIERPSSEDYSAVKFLYWDMINQVCLGDNNAVL